MNDVETLAHWLHLTFCRLRAGETSRRTQLLPWSLLDESARDDYRAVARELLTDPPACLCVPDVVIAAEGKE